MGQGAGSEERGVTFDFQGHQGGVRGEEQGARSDLQGHRITSVLVLAKKGERKPPLS